LCCIVWFFSIPDRLQPYAPCCRRQSRLSVTASTTEMPSFATLEADHLRKLVYIFQATRLLPFVILSFFTIMIRGGS
jgi:hypothetical protein